MLDERHDRDDRLAPRTGALKDDACRRAFADDACRAGDVVSTGTVQILGHLEGDIRAERIVVAAAATVDGVLLARTVHVDGTVNGPIVADRVTLGPTACIKGNISYETVNIATGASVTGLCVDRTRQAPVPADRDAALALPFGRVRAACGKTDMRPQGGQVRRTAVGGTGSMKAVWRAYQEGRTHG
jgi:cytoskeletal protein CcmA (bactofilin family)